MRCINTRCYNAKNCERSEVTIVVEENSRSYNCAKHCIVTKMRRSGSPSMDNDDSNEVVLSVPVGRVRAVLNWDALARMQAGCVTEGALEGAAAGECFALEDRNIMTAPWRRVFAVYDGNSFAIFDQRGQLIVEPSEGLVDGRQLKERLVEEFSESGFYYRPPRMWRSPKDRKAAASAEVEQQLDASGHAVCSSSAERLDGDDAGVDMHTARTHTGEDQNGERSSGAANEVQDSVNDEVRNTLHRTIAPCSYLSRAQHVFTSHDTCRCSHQTRARA